MKSLVGNQRKVNCVAIIALATALVLHGLSAGPAKGYEPRVGDVVFQSFPHSPLTDMIEGITQSAYSHCGIVAQEKGQWKVIEAVGPVREIPLDQWIRQGRGGGFAAFRLKAAYVNDIAAFVDAAKAYMGRPYDIHYEMDDAKIYCSELVFKAFRKAAHEDLGHLVKLRELKWEPYSALIEQIEGGPMPLDREIITPRNIATAEQLQRIYSHEFPTLVAANTKMYTSKESDPLSISE